MRRLLTLCFSPCHSSSSSSATVDHVGDHDAGGHFSNKDAPVPSLHSYVEPHPLPLPESRLPSPTGFPMRSVIASPDTRRNMEQAETRSSRMVLQDLGGSENPRDCIPVRSASSSPFASPSISPQRNGDSVPYYYVTPRGNQFWSAPLTSTSEARLPPPAFFDLSTLGTNASQYPHQSRQVRGPQGHLRSSSGPPSTIHTLEISTARRESNSPVSVHPLPLPPWAALPSPSAEATLSHTVAKAEPLPMKSQWQKGELIGRGTFGSVYVATNSETGALCAMKEVKLYPNDPKSVECMKQIQQEIKVLSHLKHTNIVRYYGSERVEDRFYIYQEYVHPGSINKYVHKRGGTLTESVIQNFTRHILSGLAYLHSKKTIHRDIKGANLLVDSAGVVKLANFGMAMHLPGYEPNLSLGGSSYWMAPEVVMQKDKSSDLAFAMDIWSLGCTIIEMFTGKPPWSEYDRVVAAFKVTRDSPPIPETLSSEGKDFLRCCFKRNPAERPSAADLLEHLFLKNSQQPDVLSPTQQYNGTSFMDKPRRTI